MSFLLFRGGDGDLKIGLEMVHKKVTEKAGQHIMHGIGYAAGNPLPDSVHPRFYPS